MRHTPSTIKQLITEKVEGVWVKDYDEKGHYYVNTISKKRVPSVTTKLGILKKEHLEKWKIKLAIEFLEQENRWQRLAGEERYSLITAAQLAHKDVSGAAASAGSKTHQCIEAYLLSWLSKGYPPKDIRTWFGPDADPQSIAGARAAEKLFKENDIVPVATELLVGDESVNSAGQLDFLCFWNKRLTLVDWKLANSIDDGYAVQASAYKKMFERMTKLRIKDIKILQLSKNYDSFNIYLVPNVKEAFKSFKGLSMYYDWYHNGQDKTPRDKKIVYV